MRQGCRPAMSDRRLDQLIAVGLEQAEARMELDRTLEARAQEWLAKLRPPASDADRRALVEMRDQFRDVANSRLESVSETCAQVPGLIGGLGVVDPQQQGPYLRKHLATLLEGTGKTVHACGVVLDLCLRIDEVLAAAGGDS